MYKHAVFFLVILIGFAAEAQTVNLQGIVSNSTGQPIPNAIVALVRQAMKDTTGTDGSYSFSRTVAVQLSPIVPQTQDISMNRGLLLFTLNNASPIRVELFDVQGKLLKKVALDNAAAGAYCFNMAKSCQAANLFIIKAAIGKNEASFPYMSNASAKYSFASSSAKSSSIVGVLAPIAATVDTLKITANGFQTKTVAITSYSNQQQNISLDSSKGNAPGGSIGCGKDLSTLKSGTYTITSAGLSRQYIIDIPTGYDKTHPYRLIFGMHCYGSSMGGVASDKYYQLKRFADSTKTPCIFVAPNGYGSGTPLWDQGEKDHTFFNDMLTLFKEGLCVDTTRVFSCGFSYGAMFSYSLSISHQKQLRAVACYAPANWNIWLPTDTHEPIAYFQTTGTDDPNCKWIFDDTKEEGGKYCLLGHMQDNSCTIPSTIPLATSSKHLSTEFSGCKSGYPVVFGSFQGGHQCGPMDGVSGDNSSKSWIPGETWKFFMQF